MNQPKNRSEKYTDLFSKEPQRLRLTWASKALANMAEPPLSQLEGGYAFRMVIADAGLERSGEPVGRARPAGQLDPATRTCTDLSRCRSKRRRCRRRTLKRRSPAL